MVGQEQLKRPDLELVDADGPQGAALGLAEPGIATISLTASSTASCCFGVSRFLLRSKRGIIVSARPGVLAAGPLVGHLLRSDHAPRVRLADSRLGLLLGDQHILDEGHRQIGLSFAMPSRA